MKLVNYEDVIDIVFNNFGEDMEDKLELLSTLPKTDVVRCKDCTQFRKKGEGYGCCLEGYGNVDGNHYCSYGERRDESEVEE